MRIHITGIAGVLGSGLAELFYEKGYEVSGNDVVRPEDAWRLRERGLLDNIKYFWKSSTDLSEMDLYFKDVIIDAGLMVPDRDFGITSPEFTMINNLMPSLRILETLKNKPYKPIVIYPSSFNALYGYNTETLSDELKPYPSTLYGWTKGAVELLYLSYHLSYKIPVIITRVGSAYGPYMRKSELIGKIITHIIEGKKEFRLKSPYARRLWTYNDDVLYFYSKLIENEEIDRYFGKVLHCAGNLNNEIITNMDLIKKIMKITNTDIYVILDEYEPGEKIHGEPINFSIQPSKFEWYPAFSLDRGIEITYKWFKNHYERFGW